MAPSLKTGEKLVCFHSSGTVSEKIERLIMKVREEVPIGAASFKRPTDMLSSPLALFKWRLLMNLKISAQVAGLRKKVD